MDWYAGGISAVWYVPLSGEQLQWIPKVVGSLQIVWRATQTVDAM